MLFWIGSGEFSSIGYRSLVMEHFDMQSSISVFSSDSLPNKIVQVEDRSTADRRVSFVDLSSKFHLWQLFIDQGTTVSIETHSANVMSIVLLYCTALLHFSLTVGLKFYFCLALLLLCCLSHSLPHLLNKTLSHFFYCNGAFIISRFLHANANVVV